MSTLSGIVSKGEKGKSKFQSLDINSLYRVSRGESLEQHQQKSTLPRKHGMQSLGKVPSARRPPANLPSLKSEHSNSDPAVSLVPSGGSGWATTKEPAPSTTNTTTSATASTPSDTTTSNSSPAQCAPGTNPASTTPLHPPLPGQQQNASQNPQSSDASNKSSWSAIMSRPGDVGGPVAAAVVGYAGLVGGAKIGRGALGLSFLAHQSPQFQHEFPSLSGQASVSVSVSVSVSTQSQTQQSSATSNAIPVAVQQQSLVQQQQQQQQQQQPNSHNHSGGPTPGQQQQQQQQQQSQQNRELNAQYGPGPSLRPQTEGSWIQGGSRTAGGPGASGSGPGNGNTPGVQGPPIGGNVGGTSAGHQDAAGGGRPNLAQSPGMGMAQGGLNGTQNNQSLVPSGPHQVVPNMHHYRGLIPPFMYRGNFPGGFPSQFPGNMAGSGGPRPRFNYPQERFPPPQRQQERERAQQPVEEELITRPIIKEEDLTQMDDISREVGWAAHDDIDYNQKLAFSDDEPESEPLKKDDQRGLEGSKGPSKDDKRDETPLEDRDKLKDIRNDRDRDRDSRDARDQPSHRPWNQQPSTGPRDFRGTNRPSTYPQQQMRSGHPLRGVEDEEIWNQRRREQGEKVASAVERARQRKEEEEKRFQELTKQAAAKKLQDLEQKLKEKQAKQKDDECVVSSEPKGSLITVPPVPIPIPEWERERESRERERSRTSSEGRDEKSVGNRDAVRDSRESRDQSASECRPVDRPGSTAKGQQQQEVLRDREQRDRERDRDRDRDRDRERERERERDQRETRDRDQPAFSRYFQNNLPPRFQKQQAERSGAGASVGSGAGAGSGSGGSNTGSGSGYNRVSPNTDRPSTSQPGSFSQQYDPGRWSHCNHPSSLNSGMKQSHSMPPPQRRIRADSELSGTPEEDRPPSRDLRNAPVPSREERYRHSSHRSYDSRKNSGYYDDYNRGYREYEYDDRHSRDSWDRDRHYADKDRDSRDAPRDVRDRDNRDTREKKDYDNYSKNSVQQDPFDDRDLPRERSESSEWRDDRRDLRDERNLQDRSIESRRDPPRDERIERNDRPQRPDSRDSRASRESRTSIRDDESHKSRDCGSWVNDISDYDEKKRDLYRDDNRDRDRDRERDRERERERDRDRRQAPGPVTREKLEADELKAEKRCMTQLKRSSSELEKKDVSKESPAELKKESEVWNRKLERAPENGRAMERPGDNSPKAWADAVSPTFEKEEEKLLEPIKDEKDLVELKQSMEKLSVDKRDDTLAEDSKEDSKDEKRDKNVRNRTNSGSSRGRESRGGRPWGGAYSSVYSRGWRGPESRRRRGGPRSMCRPGSARSGSYGHTDSEMSGDEISGSTESGKEERRSTRSPKPSQKLEKEDRNREVSRREEKRGSASGTGANVTVGSGSNNAGGTGANEYSQSRNDKRSYDGRPSREGFAPSGQPSRLGRGGFGMRGATTGGRMEVYGPPPSKSPFSTERNADEKLSGGSQQGPPTPTPESEANATMSSQLESSDDKIIAKQQALTAGITGRHTKSPNQQSHQGNNKQDNNLTSGHNPVPQRTQSRKEEPRSKRNQSGSRRGKESREPRFRASGSNISKQNSSDVGNEEWETTSENSEEHVEERKESRNSRNKQFANRGNQGSTQNLSSNNAQSRRGEQGGNNRDREKSSKSSSATSRAPGAEKRNAQNASFNNPRNHSGNIPPLMQNAQAQNGRLRNQGSANSAPISGKNTNKESTVNRVDEIKLNNPNLVNQVLSDMKKKTQGKDKKVIEVDTEVNNYSAGGDDAVNSAEDKLDSDGFQEVRSKKNVKESRHSQKEEPKSTRRDKDKERDRDRDRSKSKSNGSQPSPQQIQNIPPLLGQPIPQPANMPAKQFDRNPNRQKLPPRFMKQRLAMQQQQQQLGTNESVSETNSSKLGNSNNSGYNKDSSSGGPAPPPTVNAWDKPFTSQLRSNSPSSSAAVPADIQLMSGLTAQNDHSHESNEQINSGGSSQRNSPNNEKPAGKITKDSIAVEKNVSDGTSPPLNTLIFENTNYSKTTKSAPTDLAIKSKFSNHIKNQPRIDKRSDDMEEENGQLQHQQQALSVAFSSKANDLMKDKTAQQEPIQMPLSFTKSEDNADMKLDFTFDSDLSQLTDDKSKTLGMPRSMHMTGGQSTISPSTAELNLKIASVKKVWENTPPMPTVVEHEDGSVVSTPNSFPQAFESSNVDDSYNPHQQYNQANMKNEITTSTNVCKLVPPQVKPQQQTSGSSGAQPGSAVPGPSPIGPGQSPIGHPPASLQGPLSPPPFNSTGQPSHINYQEFPQYPGSQAAQYGSMSAIPSPPAVLFNTGTGQLPAQAGGLYGAFQLDQSRSPFTQYPPYGPSLQSSFNQQNVYLQQPPPPPHAPNAPTPDMYQSNLSQYRITAAAAPPFGQNQQLSNNPNTVLISSSSNSLMSASVKPSSQPIGAIGTKAPHFQAPSAPQPNQLTYIPYDPNQVLGVSGSYMGNSQLVQRPGPSVQPSANSYYSATSAGKPNTLLYVFPGSQTGFYQPGGAAQQTGTPYGLQGFGQHSQSLATGSATPVGLQNFSSQFLSGSGLQIAAAAAAQQYRNPAGGLPGPANAAATFLSKHQQQEQPRQLKSPSGNQQDVLASVFSSTPQIPSPKSRTCKQQTSSQQPQPSPTQHHKYQQYQGVSQSALVLQQNVRGMGMPPRAGIQPSQQRYPPPIQRPVVPFPPGPNPNNPSQQQPNCMPSQQQQTQMNRHRPNLHQQQQQQRNMKMQQQYYSAQGNVKMDSTDKNDSHSDKIADAASGTQTGGTKPNVNQQDGENKEEVNHQNE